MSKSIEVDYWNDPELTAQVDAGIEQHRKSDATLRFVDAQGLPVSGLPVAIEQANSSFHFGANIFMLGGYATAELNHRYEEAFAGLFNAATVPFYWRGLEPEQGALRFSAGSPFLARRPPPDTVIDFCSRHGLRMHGHVLVWNFVRWSVPDWLPDDPALNGPLWEKRISEIAQRYAAHIHRWDVLNEAVPDRHYPDVRGVPPGYERLAFEWAERYFPRETRFDINEINDGWTSLREPYVELIRRLRARGARIGGIGLQFHMWNDDMLRQLLTQKIFPARVLLGTLDAMQEFQTPVHVSEITLTAPDNSADGQAEQARAARSLYRLWFSHPAVEGITWWNVPDGGAAPGEDKVFSGMLTRELEPKQCYHVLRDLLQREWRTRLNATTDQDGRFAFRGFHGDYRVRAGIGEAVHARTFTLGPGTAEIRIELS